MSRLDVRKTPGRTRRHGDDTWVYWRDRPCLWLCQHGEVSTDLSCLLSQTARQPALIQGTSTCQSHRMGAKAETRNLLGIYDRNSAIHEHPLVLPHSMQR